MGVYSEEAGAGGVYTGYDEVCSDVALVPEEVLLKEGHAGNDTGFAAGGEGMKFELGGDDGGDKLGTGRSGVVNIRLIYVEDERDKEETSYSAAVPAPVEGLLSVGMSLGSPHE